MSADIVTLPYKVVALSFERHPLGLDDLLEITGPLNRAGLKIDQPHATLDGFAFYVETEDGRRLRVRLEGTAANARPGTCSVLADPQQPAPGDDAQPDGAA